MLWEVEIRPQAGEIDYEGRRVLAEGRGLGAGTLEEVKTARSFLIQSDSGRERIEQIAAQLLTDPVVERQTIRPLSSASTDADANGDRLLNVL
ncbi:MAG TPA: phosphoribosylformylglycinamidine synthase subunit PurS, partial [Planctomycetaceae bacterium]|nr:phosphoribosylformylglycinamidine synthase subunit PurS [Planctomycetaceae bacterium]